MTVAEKIAQIREEKLKIQKEYSEIAKENFSKLKNKALVTKEELEKERRLFAQFNEVVSWYSKVVMLISSKRKKLTDEFNEADFFS
jgi:hypothetical protein